MMSKNKSSISLTIAKKREERIRNLLKEDMKYNN